MKHANECSMPEKETRLELVEGDTTGAHGVAQSRRRTLGKEKSFSTGKGRGGNY